MNKVTQRIVEHAREAARTFALEFPGEPYDSRWFAAAYEYDAARRAWPDDSFATVYEPAARKALAGE